MVAFFIVSNFFCQIFIIEVKLHISLTMRGSRTLYDNIFVTTDTATDVVAEKPRKGRNPELANTKNRCLVHRYYYYGKFSNKRYPDIIKDLSREFWLTPSTIPRILDEYYSELQYLKTVATSKDFFKKEWPHLVW